MDDVKHKATVAELEAILNGNEPCCIRVNSDGSIDTVPDLQTQLSTALEQVAKLTAALEYCSDGGDNCQDHSTVALAELKAERGRG